MLLPEGATLAMGRAQEEDIDPFQVDDVGEDKVRVAHEAGMMFRHGLSHLALRMDPGDFGRRMVHQQPDQFAGGIAGSPDDTRADRTGDPCTGTSGTRGPSGCRSGGSPRSPSRTRDRP